MVSLAGTLGRRLRFGRPHPARQRLHRGCTSRPARRPFLSTAAPLDAIDGAARVYDPILRGLAGEPVFGRLLKNYSPVGW